MTQEVKKDEDWMQKKWRPAMGWMYMIICFFDMVIFPILWAIVQSFSHQQLVQWNPLTLQGAGLFHIAMGAVLGIAAFGRTQEKLAGTAANPTATTSTQNMNMTGNTAGGYGSNAGGMNNGMGGGFGGSTGGFGGAGNGGFGSTSSTPAFGAPQAGGFNSAPSGFAPPASPTPAAGFGASPAPFNQGATSPAAVAAPVTNPAADPSVDLGLHPDDPPTRNTRSDGIETEGTI
jgi:hypothetical protein